jgi:thiol:disulfide interchange protein
MQKNALRGALAGACLLWAAGAAHAAPVQGMPWAKSLQTAMAEAKKSDKLVLLDFYTDW